LDLARVASRARGRLAEKLRREPTLLEISDAVGLPPKQVDGAMKSIPHMESLDAPAIEDGAQRWELQPDENSVSPWKGALDRDMRDKVQAALEVLPQRQRVILRMRYGIGLNAEYNLEEIGKTLSLTRERVRQLELDSLRRLRAAGRHRGLQSFLAG
jgi:RNA polymerase primary sigma factor